MDMNPNATEIGCSKCVLIKSENAELRSRLDIAYAAMQKTAERSINLPIVIKDPDGIIDRLRAKNVKIEEERLAWKGAFVLSTIFWSTLVLLAAFVAVYR